MQSIADKLGRGIRSHRKAQNMSSYDLARQAGISRRYITAVENGKQSPTYPVVKSIAEALGVGIDELEANDD